MRPALRSLKLRYDTPEAMAQDPLIVALRYTEPMDREVAAYLAASLAYGRVAPMLRAITAAIAPLGDRPAAWLRALGPNGSRLALEKALDGWVWRFHTGVDVAHWLATWVRLDEESGGNGLEAHFLPLSGGSADEAFSRLMQRLRLELPPTRGLRFSLPDPLEGSACKRWRMFLRWMARTGWPDLGQWTRYSAASLIIPVDTHVARISRYLGLTRRTTPDGRMAAEITEALRRADPSDPLTFDFAISHLGILGDCPGIRTLPDCKPCPLVKVCKAGKPK
jgi:uncharacterized protein (TIGR02757 family)